MRSAIVLFLMTISGCSESNPCADFERKFSGKYAGVVLITYNGDAIFAPDQNCRISVSGSYEIHKRISEEWERSNYDRIFMPIRAEMTGSLTRKQGDKNQLLLDLKSFSKSTSSPSEKEISLQFQRAMGRDIKSTLQ